MAIDDQSRGSTSPSNPLFAFIRKIWNAIFIGLAYISIFGGFLMMTGLLPDKKEVDKESNTNIDTNSSQGAQDSQSRGIRNAWPAVKNLRENKTLRSFYRPTSFEVPYLVTTYIVLYAFCSLINHEATFNGTADFSTACPPDGRRTQTSAFVQLFAASVTTICIHGHLGSLAGSGSWRRELFRAIEVLVWPLSSLFVAAQTLWYELASLSVFNPDPWTQPVGFRYRLARMCSVRVDVDTPTSSDSPPNLYLASINPIHIKTTPLPHGIKWTGRVLILIILAAQYIQAGILLVRRLASNTATTIDAAMFFLVLSGLIALTHSLTISLIHTSWTLDRDSPACLARSCYRPACISLKAQEKLPSVKTQALVFGVNILGLPRAVLVDLAAAHLQLCMLIFVWGLGEREKWWNPLVTLGVLRFAWKTTVSAVIYAEVLGRMFVEREDGEELGKRESASADADAGEKTETSPPAPPSPSLPTPTTASPSSLPPYTLSNFLFNIAMFVVGLGAIIGVAALLFLQCYMLFAGPMGLVGQCVEEMGKWKAWDGEVPCPGMWKDGLEDELWWF